VTIAFLVGKTDDEGVNKKIKSEFNLYGDVLLANFQDSYQNLTLKTMAMLEWTRYYCSKADYVLEADDEFHDRSIVFI
jgi:beta-1,3-galactosyltransferase 1